MIRRDFLRCSALLGLAAFAGLSVQAAAPSSFTKQQYRSAYDTLPYWLYTPENAAPGMPLLVYLHGGSGKGSDLSLLLSADSLPKFLQTGQLALSAYVLMPQLPKNCIGWTDKADALLSLIQDVVSRYSLDEHRISLTGHSMGGTGVWAIAQTHPESFSAIAPLSGGVTISSTTLDQLAELPIWAVVGAKDTIVPPESSERLIERLSQINPDCRCTVLPDADHFAVPQIYLDENTGLLNWLISQSR